MNWNGIQNIIFDFGGVILNLDYHLTSTAFEKIGLTSFDDLYTQFGQSHLFDQLETGKISAEEFRNAIKKHLPEGTTNTQIDAAWNAMLLNHPKERLDMLHTLKGSFRTFLLSNTNIIHYHAFRKILWEEHQMDGLDTLFEQVYYSHDIGLRKPHPETFQWVLDQNNLKAEETLFIDDSPQHIEGAKAAGLQTYHLKKGEEITELFSDFLAKLHQ